MYRDLKIITLVTNVHKVETLPKTFLDHNPVNLEALSDKN